MKRTIFDCAPDLMISQIHDLAVYSREAGHLSMVLFFLVAEKKGPIRYDLWYFRKLTGISEKKIKAALAELENLKLIYICDDLVSHEEALHQIQWTKPPRPSISRGLRQEIIERDGWSCLYCKDEIGPFEFDHIIPVSRGGQSVPENITIACKACNRSKRDKTIKEWRATR